MKALTYPGEQPLALLGQLVFQTEGEIFIEGREITGLSGGELAELRLRRIGFVFQEYNLIPVLTAIENVEYVMLLQGVRERTGVDAVNIDYSFGPLAGLNIVYAPGNEKTEGSAGARVRTNIRGYDLSIMTGEFRKNTVMGLDFAGNIGDSGFRGEGVSPSISYWSISTTAGIWEEMQSLSV